MGSGKVRVNLGWDAGRNPHVQVDLVDLLECMSTQDRLQLLADAFAEQAVAEVLVELVAGNDSPRARLEGVDVSWLSQGMRDRAREAMIPHLPAAMQVEVGKWKRRVDRAGLYEDLCRRYMTAFEKLNNGDVSGVAESVKVFHEMREACARIHHKPWCPAHSGGECACGSAIPQAGGVVQ